MFIDSDVILEAAYAIRNGCYGIGAALVVAALIRIIRGK
jgi:hypothetical protein